MLESFLNSTSTLKIETENKPSNLENPEEGKD